MKILSFIFTFVTIFLLFTPFVVSNKIFDGGVWGSYYYTIGLGAFLLLAVCSILFFKNGTLEINITSVDILLILLMAYIGIRFTFTPFTKTNIGYFYLIALFVVVIKVFKPIFERHQKQLLFLITVLFAAGTFEGGYGILQQMDVINHIGHFKVVGSFNNPGPYSNYLVVVLVFAYGFFLHFEPISILQKVLQYFALATAIIITIVLPFTEARTSWVAAIVGIVALSWSFVKTKPIIKVMVGNGIMKAFSISVFLGVIIISSVFLYQYKIQSAKGRLLIYEVSLNMIKEKPIFGHGFCRFPSEYNNYQADYFKNYPNSDKVMLADNVKTGFNEFLQITVEFGIVGLMLFIGLIVLIFRSKTSPEWKCLALPAKGSLLAALVCCLFSYPLHVLPVAVILVFLLAAIMVANIVIGYCITIGRWVYKPMALVVSVSALFVCYLQWKDFEARKQWKQAIDYTHLKDYEKALPCYLNAYKILNYDGFFLYNYGSELLDVNPEQGTKILEEATHYLSDSDLYVYLGDGYREIKKYAKAEECYLLSSYMVPCKFYPRYQLFKLYCETNQCYKAQAVAKTIAMMSVKVPSETVSEIKAEVFEWLENQK